METLRMVPFSGGFDSTCIVCRYMAEGTPFVAHHVHIINTENRRYASEANAFRRVSDAIRERFGDFNLTKSVHKYMAPGWYGWDILTAAYHAAVAAEGFLRKSGGHLVELHLAIPAESFRGHGYIKDVQLRAEDMFSAYFRVLGVDAVVTYPLKDTSKAEIISGIPENVRRHCFTCRAPIGILVPCGACKSCRMAIQAGA